MKKIKDAMFNLMMWPLRISEKRSPLFVSIVGILTICFMAQSEKIVGISDWVIVASNFFLGVALVYWFIITGVIWLDRRAKKREEKIV